MKKLRAELRLGAILLVLSALFYYIHYLLFGDSYNIFYYMVMNIAFLPIEVFLVTLVMQSLLDSRDRKSKLEKLNMVIGVFFSETGTELLSCFSRLDPDIECIRSNLLINAHWEDKEFAEVFRKLKVREFNIDESAADWEALAAFMISKREFLIKLLENPALLEHETFTELLRSVFHLEEELSKRKDLKGLGAKDREHLAFDMKRAYKLLLCEWLSYMKYLKTEYPYLFSFALRTNPFDNEASVEIK